MACSDRSGRAASVAPWLWELDEQRGQYTAAWVLVERGELSEAAQAEEI